MKNCFTKCSLKVIHLEMSPAKWWAFGSPLQCMDIVTHKHVLTRTHGSASSAAGIQVPTWLPFGIRPAIAPSGLYPSPFTDDAVSCWYRRSFKSAMSHLPGRNKINLMTTNYNKMETCKLCSVSSGMLQVRCTTNTLGALHADVVNYFLQQKAHPRV